MGHNGDARMCINDRNTAGVCNQQPPAAIKWYYNYRWPDSRDELHAGLQSYWSYRDELAVIDGIILKGKCIIIPNSLKEQVLNQLHTNHLGIEKTKLLASESVYWPSINADIKNT